MKKKLFYFIMLIGLFLPFNVFAAELPREGVTYFFLYPNGLETASTNYEDTLNPKEELILSATTDENGQVVLNGLADEGELRIVSKDENGAAEVTVNLVNHSSVEVVKTNLLVNPKTGKSILLLVEVLFVLLGFYLLAFRFKKSGLFLFIISAFAFALLNVKADQEDFVITVKDDDGNTLANAKVEVYAKPVIEAQPAILLHANGGRFLDGSKEMYARLPYDGCNQIDLLDYLYDEYYDSYANIFFMSMNGYIPLIPEMSDSLYNGDEYDMDWEIAEWSFPEFDLNGGVFNFRGKKITKIPAYSRYNEFYDYVYKHSSNDGLKLIGYDTEQSCSNYDENGLADDYLYDFYHQETIYFCWNQRPDGFYVNDNVYVGNVDNCYSQSGWTDSCETYHFYHPFNNSQFNLSFYDSVIQFRPIEYFVQTEITKSTPTIGNSSFTFNSISASSGLRNIEYINSIEIVEDGEIILSLNSDDFHYDRNNEIYNITNSTKNRKFLNYINRMLNNQCVYECGTL